MVGNRSAIEIKAARQVTEGPLRGLRALGEEQCVAKRLVVSRDAERRRLGGIEIYPWREFLTELWADRLPGLG